MSKEICEDCGKKEFTIYNADKGMLCCAECGQFKEIATLLMEKSEPVAKSPAAMAGSEAHFKPASDYTDEGLVQLALEVYARAASYMTKELHDRAMEAKQELLKRLIRTDKLTRRGLLARR